MKAYEEKIINVEQALAMINSNDDIVSALAAAEPREILSHLHTIGDRVKNVTVTTCLPQGSYPFFMDPAYKDAFKMEGWFYSPAIRKAHQQGQASFIPNHLHLSGVKRLFHRKPTIFIGTCSMPDEHGYVSLSLSATYERLMIDAAELVILEANPNMPRTFGDTMIHHSEVDHFLEVDYPAPELAIGAMSEKDEIIGNLIASLVEDGSTIQLGIGGIPNAVTKALLEKRDLGIHTEMFTDGMIDLIEKGVITGSKKTLLPKRIVATFALGTKRLYDFIDNNPGVLINNGNWVNDPYVIGKNTKMVSINTSIEIDLTGQCCSESIGHKQFSGTGGQADTAIGAQISEGGKSIIALYSTAMVKNHTSGEREMISKIVPLLKPGAAVSLSRNDVDYVVTEYGIASLRGTSVRERVERLVAIAHPDLRESLINEAKALGIV